MTENYTYEKYDEEGNVQYCPGNDYDRSITGHIVIGVKCWFDENPEERKRLGWIKHIHHNTDELDYDPQTQYITTTTRQIDEWTIEDEHHIVNKSEEMLLLEEMLSALNYNTGGFITLLDGGR